ncbi:MAG: hypothetical protein H0X51_05400 [Parachlamydiaceae bacterium]|nr:hypothetical protein [Parachlamydiaceae bacterium]
MTYSSQGLLASSQVHNVGTLAFNLETAITQSVEGKYHKQSSVGGRVVTDPTQDWETMHWLERLVRDLFAPIFGFVEPVALKCLRNSAANWNAITLAKFEEIVVGEQKRREAEEGTSAITAKERLNKHWIDLDNALRSLKIKLPEEFLSCIDRVRETHHTVIFAQHANSNINVALKDLEGARAYVQTVERNLALLKQQPVVKVLFPSQDGLGLGGTETQSSGLESEIENLRKELIEAQRTAQECQDQYDALLAENGQLGIQNAELTARAERGEKSHRDAISNTGISLNSAQDKHTTELARIREEMELLTTGRSQAEQALAEKQQHAAELEASLAAASATIDQERAAQAALQAKLSALETLQKRVKELEAQSAKSSQDNEAAQQVKHELAQVRSELTEANASVRKLTREKLQLEDMKEVAVREMHAGRDRISALGSDLASLKQEYSDLELAKNELESRCKALAESETKWKLYTNDVNEANDAIAELTGRVKALTSERDANTQTCLQLRKQILSLEAAAVDNEKNQAAIQELQKELSELMSQNEQLQRNLQLANQTQDASFVNLVTQLTAAEAARSKFEQQVLSLQQQLQGKDQSIGHLKSQLAGKQAEFTTQKEQLDQQKALCTELQTQLQAAKEGLLTKTDLLTELQTKLATQTERADALQGQLSAKVDQIAQLRAELETQQQLLQQAKENATRDSEAIQTKASLLSEAEDAAARALESVSAATQAQEDAEEKAQILQQELVQALSDKTELASTLAAAQGAVADTTAAQAEMDSQVSALRAELQQVQAQLKSVQEASQAKEAALQKSNGELEAANLALRTRQGELEQTLKTQQQQHQDAEKANAAQLAHLREGVQAANSQRHTVEQQLSQSQALLAQKVEEAAKFQGKCKELKALLEGKEKAFRDSDDALQRIDQQLQVAQKECDSLRTMLASSVQGQTERQTAEKSLKQQHLEALDGKQYEVYQAKASNAQIAARLLTKEQQCLDLQQQLDKMRPELAASQKALLESQQQLKAAQTQLQQAKSGQDGLVQQLQHENGQLRAREKELGDTISELVDRLKKQALAVDATSAQQQLAAETRQKQYNEQLDRLSADLESQLQAWAKEKADFEPVKAKLAAAEASLAKVQLSLTQANKTNQQLKEQIASLNAAAQVTAKRHAEQVTQLSSEKATAKADLAKAAQELQALRSTMEQQTQLQQDLAKKGVTATAVEKLKDDLRKAQDAVTQQAQQMEAQKQKEGRLSTLLAESQQREAEQKQKMQGLQSTISKHGPLVAQVAQLEAQLSALNQEAATAKAKVSRLEAEKNGPREESAKLRGAAAQAKAESEGLQKQIVELTAEISKQKTLVEKEKVAKRAALGRIKPLEVELTTAQQSLQEAQAETATARASAASTNDLLEAARARSKQQLEAQAKASEALLVAARRERAEALAALEAMKAEVATKSKEIDDKQKLIIKLLGRAQEAERKLKQAGENQPAQGAGQPQSPDKAELKRQLGALRAQVAAEQKQLAELRGQREAEQKRLAELQEQLATTKQDADRRLNVLRQAKVITDRNARNSELRSAQIAAAAAGAGAAVFAAPRQPDPA